jgi:hypothetical protein
MIFMLKIDKAGMPASNSQAMPPMSRQQKLFASK